MHHKTDPVCGMTVSDPVQFTLTRQAVNYYFCSEGCLKSFRADPDKFAPSFGEPVEIKSGVYWVGAQDHSAGLAVNSYLIKDKKIGLIYDCTTHLKNETMAKVSKITDVEKIDYLIPTHFVFGQCCGFQNVGQMASNSELVASEELARLQTLALLKDSPPIGRTVEGSGQEVLDFGGRKVYVLPNCLAGANGSVSVYDEKSRILFSGDFLSTSSPYWDRRMTEQELAQAIKVYQTLKHPWIKLASKAKLKKELVKFRSLKIDVIAPSQGTIIRGNVDACLDAFLDICDEE